MNLINSTSFLLVLVAITGLIHAFAQAPLSFLLQMAGNSLGNAKPKRALLLSFLMSCGVFLIITLLLIVSSVMLFSFFDDYMMRRFFAGIIAVIAGVYICFRYFRVKRQGTELWINRQLSRGLQKTVDEARRPGAAFGVGMLAVLIELPLTLPLLFIAAILSNNMSGYDKVLSLIYYALAVVLPLVVTGLFMFHGKTIVALQKQRVHGKLFLQTGFGLAMILLGVYVASGAFEQTGSLL
jgi:hypothetical protein